MLITICASPTVYLHPKLFLNLILNVATTAQRGWRYWQQMNAVDKSNSSTFSLA